jgi:hypothetical protein
MSGPKGDCFLEIQAALVALFLVVPIIHLQKGPSVSSLLAVGNGTGAVTYPWWSTTPLFVTDASLAV